MAVGRKTGGRKKGSLNKVKPRIKAQQVVEAQLEAALAKCEKSPLEQHQHRLTLLFNGAALASGMGWPRFLQ
jgi:hypothetical protein